MESIGVSNRTELNSNLLEFFFYLLIINLDYNITGTVGHNYI